ncbi:MAG: arylamine N-acetyltransferase [Acidobacteriota bacterium]
MTIPVDEILEDLEVSRADPGPGFLERLFLRFNERVPFETASKIRRHAQVANPVDKPRLPEIFWRERLESGAGGTCFARVAAFDALLRGLGFVTRLALGRVRSDFDHAALFVFTADTEWLCDAGFPLPALLPARLARVETPLGGLEVTRTARGLRVDFDGGVPDGPRHLEVFDAPLAEGEFEARWRETFRADSKFLSEVVLHRILANRRTVFARGSLRIDDLHSRLRIPLESPRSGALEAAFGVEASFLDEAFALAGDPDPESGNASVEAFLESPVPSESAFSAIATPEGYTALHAGFARVTTASVGPGAFSVRLVPEGGGGEPPPLEETVRIDDAAKTVAVSREGRDSSWIAEEREGVPWLVRRTILEGPRLDLLRNDSLRGRLAGILALDLLAWTRRLAAGSRP